MRSVGSALRVLVVTGKLAEDSLRKIASEVDMDVDVYSLPVSVAAFITPEYAARALSRMSVQGYDIILMPGTVRGDVSPVEMATGVPTFKGPSYSNELPLILELLGEIELSKTATASTFIRDSQKERAVSELEDVKQNWQKLLRIHGGLIIGVEGQEVPVGGAFPMRVIAEIVNAPTLDVDSVRRRARYYASEGADIIDIGMLAGRSMPEAVEGLVEAVRSSVELPISIDTLNPEEIIAAVDAGIDLVLSVDMGNMEDVASYVSDIPVVVLPSNMKEGVLPEEAEERVTALRENIQKARDLGIEKIVADPVLEPVLKPGLLEALMAYKIFRQSDKETPVLFGLGNVTELIDVDSTGVNGLLAALACEVGADLLFIPEYSPKALGSVRETAIASKMMFLARNRDTLPKDLGLDLLVLKEKCRVEAPYDRIVEKSVSLLEAKGDVEFISDKMGWFNIQVDRERDLVVAIHFPRNKVEPDVIVKGRDSREIYQTIIRSGLISKLDHAAYLGKELEKAVLALQLGRSYVQEKCLF